MMKDWFSVGEFGRRTGLSYKALRIYEEKGILIPHSRSEGDHRVYSLAQIQIAERIVQFKDWGFSLEQIKVLLAETSEHTLKELLERRLQESRAAVVSLSSQIASLESVLASLTAGHSLTELERSQVMENLLDSSVSNLKRRGIVDDQTLGMLSQEVALYSPEMAAIIPDIRKIINFAKEKNILLGPGRGTSPASLVMYSEGYSSENPLRYGLMPELFSRSKFFHMDVEFSCHREIGKMCDDLKERSGIDVVAFRSPQLDIFADVQNKMGRVQFDKFSDFDPMILEAPKRLGIRGLSGLDWNPNYHAFQSSGQKWIDDHQRSFELMMDLLQTMTFHGPEDFINFEELSAFYDQKDFLAYPTAQCPDSLPELKNTRGYLIYREDWIRILKRFIDISVLDAREIINQIKNAKDEFIQTRVDEIPDPEIRDLLIKKARGRLSAKSHAITSWHNYKITAVLKSLWPKEYLETIDRWEDKHGMIWQEFGYPLSDGSYHLKA